MTSKEPEDDLNGAREYEMMEIGELKPYRYNSKVHSEGSIKNLMASISQFGLDHAITVDKDMIIIGGHGRVEACKRLGMKFIKVQIRADLSKKAANKLRISENRVTSTEYDTEKSKLELLEIDFDDIESLSDIDVSALGLEKIEVEKLFDDYNVVDESALTDDLDRDIDNQIKKAEQDIQGADKKMISVSVALGFKTIPVSSSKHIAKFIAGLEDEYDLPPAEAFAQFVKNMGEGRQ